MTHFRTRAAVRSDRHVDPQLVKTGPEGKRAGHGELTINEREEPERLRRENRQLLIEREILSKSRVLVRTGDATEFEALFGFVGANQATHLVVLMCRLLKVSKSGCYACPKRPRSRRMSTPGVNRAQRIASCNFVTGCLSSDVTGVLSDAY